MLKPGLALDTRVDKNVMGYERTLPCFWSTQLGDAMRLVEAMHNTWSFHFNKKVWTVKCDPRNNIHSSVVFEAQAEELPYAICICALRACGIPVD